jgi:hypothetical protein
MPQPSFVITLNDRRAPAEIRGWHDGSRAGFSTDRLRAKPFPTHRAAQTALGELRQRFPSQVIHIQGRVVAFAVGLVLAAALAGCSHTPVSSADCGRHFTGGSGLLGLVGATGAFDRPAGPDCHPSAYAGAFTGVPYTPRNETWTPPDPAPLPDNRPRFLVPGGAGTLMEIGGDVPQLLAPAGSGTFLELP